MKAVVQRVKEAKVSVDGLVVGRCRKGLLVLAAAHRTDSEANAKKLADRIWGLRIFNDETGKLNLSLRDLNESAVASVLAVSNFTIYGETSKNRRPSFMESAPFEQGREIFDHFVEALRSIGCIVETGEFGADMQVELVNDGPVTVIVDG